MVGEWTAAPLPPPSSAPVAGTRPRQPCHPLASPVLWVCDGQLRAVYHSPGFSKSGVGLYYCYTGFRYHGSVAGRFGWATGSVHHAPEYISEDSLSRKKKKKSCRHWWEHRNHRESVAAVMYNPTRMKKWMWRTTFAR